VLPFVVRVMSHSGTGCASVLPFAFLFYFTSWLHFDDIIISREISLLLWSVILSCKMLVDQCLGFLLLPGWLDQ